MEHRTLNSTGFFLILCLTILVTVPSLLIAQAPEKMNYQSIVRDNGGTPITNQNVSFRISILQDNINGTVVFSETHQVTTNQFGYASLLIGTGQVVQGSLSDIGWGSSDHFMKTEVDVNGGTNYADMGTSQLVSVPYALYANEAKTAKNGKTYLTLYGDIPDNEALLKIETETGPYTQVIRIDNTTQFSSLSLDTIQELEGLQINNNSALTTVSLPNLKSLGGSVDGNWGGTVSSNDLLTTLDLSSLEFVSRYFQLSGNSLLQSVDLGNLRQAYQVSINNSNSLTSVNLSNLETCPRFNIRDNPNLSTISFPSLDFSTLTGTVRLDANSFDSSTINSLLSEFVSANVVDLSIWLKDQTPPAPPTGQGLIDKQTLIDNGNTVYTD